MKLHEIKWSHILALDAHIRRTYVSDSSSSSTPTMGCKDKYCYGVSICWLFTLQDEKFSLLHRTLGFTGTYWRKGLGSTKSQEGWVWILPSRQSPTCNSPRIANRVTVAQFSLTKGTGSSPSRCPHPYSTGGLEEHLAQTHCLFLGLPAGLFP